MSWLLLPKGLGPIRQSERSACSIIFTAEKAAAQRHSGHDAHIALLTNGQMQAFNIGCYAD